MPSGLEVYIWLESKAIIKPITRPETVYYMSLIDVSLLMNTKRKKKRQSKHTMFASLLFIHFVSGLFIACCSFLSELRSAGHFECREGTTLDDWGTVQGTLETNSHNHPIRIQKCPMPWHLQSESRVQLKCELFRSDYSVVIHDDHGIF